MTAGLRHGIAAAAALALGGLAAPAPAQDAAAPANASETVIGPPQIQDFTLNGTVTRRAETPAPAPQPQQPRSQAATTDRSQPAVATNSSPDAGRQPIVRPEQSRQAAEAPQTDSPSQPAPAAPGLAGGSMFDLPPPTAARPATYPSPLPPADPIEETGDQSSGLLSLPWLLALLAAAGAAAWYMLRQRPRLAFAGGSYGIAEGAAEPRPAPEPLKRAPVAAPPASPAPAPQGIVSTRLRPSLDIALAPRSCNLDANGATVEFDVTVVNSGSAPARDVQVEAVMLNADAAQEEQIAAYYAKPMGRGQPIEMIAPLKSVTLRSAVTMPADRLRLFEVEGRKLFVPLIAFNALYRHSAGGAQSSSAFLVGRDGQGSKLAPFRADQGNRQFSGLAARELEPRVRK